jgi:insertion element IS1 protein InsB
MIVLICNGMECPTCNSEQTCKNGRRNGVQAYRCKQCGRQFIESYRRLRHSSKTKQICLNLYFNGMGVKAIEQVTHIHHTTILHWIRRLDLNAFSVEALSAPEQTPNKHER